MKKIALPIFAARVLSVLCLSSLTMDAEAQEADTTARPPQEKKDRILFKEPLRYGGWPANHGIWAWENEIVVGFTAGWYKSDAVGHAIDFAKPLGKWQARSLDGGETWELETPFPESRKGAVPESQPLSEALDFTSPDFALMFQHASIHVGPSWFYASKDRCRTWSGPHAFAVEGVEGIAARTDYLVLGQRECLMFGSAAKEDGKEGRVFCARTGDGGLTWRLVSLIGDEPEGYAIMPSSLRLEGDTILTTIRRRDPDKPAFIEAWRSEDLGASWKLLGIPAPGIGSGNPPSLVTLADGRLCLTYGYRARPNGIRARISEDEGLTWGPEIVLRDDAPSGDIGYPRSVVRPDGSVVTAYYFNGPEHEDRAIEATIWRP